MTNFLFIFWPYVWFSLGYIQLLSLSVFLDSSLSVCSANRKKNLKKQAEIFSLIIVNSNT